MLEDRDDAPESRPRTARADAPARSGAADTRALAAPRSAGAGAARSRTRPHSAAAEPEPRARTRAGALARACRVTGGFYGCARKSLSASAWRSPLSAATESSDCASRTGANRRPPLPPAKPYTAGRGRLL